MKYDPEKHHRRSIRLRGYDYSQPGGYYVTVITYNRECLFGEIVDGKMILNELGEIVRDEWIKTGDMRNEIELDEFVIMPNHIHGIIFIVDKHRGGNPPVAIHPGDKFRRGDRQVAPTMGSPHDGNNRRVAPTTDFPHGENNPPIAPTTPIGSVGPRARGTWVFSPTIKPGPKSKSIGAIMAGFKSAVTRRVNEYRQTPGEPVWQRNYWEHIIRDENDLYRIRKYIMNNPLRWDLDDENPDKIS